MFMILFSGEYVATFLSNIDDKNYTKGESVPYDKSDTTLSHGAENIQHEIGRSTASIIRSSIRVWI